jgi:DNA-binding beta-propeller fold protein YncE
VFLASGIGPNGKGDNSVVVFAPSRATLPSRLIVDPELSPLDLAIAPNSNIVVFSQHPFDAPNAVTSLREYDAADAHLVRIFSAKGSAKFRKPRGLRFGPDGNLYCVAQDDVRAVNV